MSKNFIATDLHGFSCTTVEERPFTGRVRAVVIAITGARFRRVYSFRITDLRLPGNVSRSASTNLENGRYRLNSRFESSAL